MTPDEAAVERAARAMIIQRHAMLVALEIGRWLAAPARQDAQDTTPPPLPGASPESLDDGWFPSRCVICWKAITQYDTYGVSHPPGRRWHWDCVRAEAAHVRPPASPAPSGVAGNATLYASGLRSWADGTHHPFCTDADRRAYLREAADVLDKQAAALTEARAEGARLREARDNAFQLLNAWLADRIGEQCSTPWEEGRRTAFQRVRDLVNSNTEFALAPPAPAAAREAVLREAIAECEAEQRTFPNSASWVESAASCARRIARLSGSRAEGQPS